MSASPACASAMSRDGLFDGRCDDRPDSRLSTALCWIAEHADGLDRSPQFPVEAFARLGAAKALGVTLEAGFSFADELGLVREVSRADGSVGRILDGHFNAVERLLVAPDVLNEADRSAIASGTLLLGVWGADPQRGEGDPARLYPGASGLRIHGVKTFCSGAGGVHRALVGVLDTAGERRLAYVDLVRGVSIDRDWYHGEGLRASESHRVTFDGAPVLALLGGPGEMLREPWFSRDAIRTSATWAGIADSVVAAALVWLHRHHTNSDLATLAAGRMRVAVGTIERWLEHAGVCADRGLLGDAAIEVRWAIAAACREIVADAASACGSWPLAVGGALSRGRRDLDLFLLQHRLEPRLAAHGAAAIGMAGDG